MHAVHYTVICMLNSPNARGALHYTCAPAEDLPYTARGACILPVKCTRCIITHMPPSGGLTVSCTRCITSGKMHAVHYYTCAPVRRTCRTQHAVPVYSRSKCTRCMITHMPPSGGLTVSCTRCMLNSGKIHAVHYYTCAPVRRTTVQ